MKRDFLYDDEALLLQIDRMSGCSLTKARIIDILRGLAGQRIRFTKRATLFPARMERALALLDQGQTMSQVKDALISCGLCNSRTVALRVARMAIDEHARKRAGLPRHPVEADFRAIVTRNSLTGHHDD